MPDTAARSLAEAKARLRVSLKELPRKPMKRATARPAPTGADRADPEVQLTARLPGAGWSKAR
jgi:hypothetical protein